jgi:4-hydroxy-3-methylbut-2-enyl diphosphate reductase IspH
VQDETGLQAHWFAAAAVVGITAGTSTPDSVIDRVERRIAELGAAAEMAAVEGSAR